MRKALLLIAAITCMGSIEVNAQVYKTVQVDTAGTLAALLSSEELASVTDLTLTGTINADDFNTMKTQMPALKVIDLGSVHATGDSIPGSAFNGGITSLILPSSITLLGNFALAGCGLLTTLTVPSLVRSVGDNAFAGCSGLTSIILGESLSSIGRYAFEGCSGLTSVTILSAGETTIGEYAFAGNANLSSVTIHPSLGTSIGKYAFLSCRSLKTLKMSSPSVTSIGEGSFIYSGIDTLVFPSSLTSVDKSAFIYCDSLKSVTFLSSSGATIGDNAFINCSNLESVHIQPSSVTSIGKNAFVNCRNLRTLIMLSPSVTSIGEGCFIQNSIDTLVFPSSLTLIDKYAFQDSDSLKSVSFLPSSGATIRDWAFAYCPKLVSVRMQSPSVDSIGERCFHACSNLTSLTIPSSLAYIGNYAFKECNIMGSLTMPSSLIHIGDYAFVGIQGIDTLTFLPTSGTSIGEGTFYGCRGLISLIMYSPSVVSIGHTSFDSSEGLTNVILPSSLTSIDVGAFGRCYGLRKIRINRLIPPVISEHNIFNYLSTGAIDLYVPAGTKDAYQAAEVWSGFHIIEFDVQLTASPDTLAMADTAGSTVTFDIQSSTNWQVSSDQSWLTADPVLGMDTVSITLTAEANPDTIAREAIVTVSGENVETDTLLVTQAPRPFLSVSAGVLDVGPLAGSTAQFTIASNQHWTVQSGQTWLVVEPSTGMGNGAITMTAETNPDTTIREAIVTVYTGRLTPQTILVTQAPKPFLSVSSGIVEIGSQGGSTALFSIASNTDWTIQSDQTWLSTSSSSGSGNVEITVTAEANPDTTAREAIVTVSASGLPAQTVMVTQEAAIPSGFSEASRERIVIFPNPVKDALHIDNAAGNIMILLDMQGRVIFSRSLYTNHESIDLSSLSPGNYMIKIGDKIVKIVK